MFRRLVWVLLCAFAVGEWTYSQSKGDRALHYFRQAVEQASHQIPPEVHRSFSQDSGANLIPEKYAYHVLATNKTSTMQKELNEATAEGFRFAGVMGGETAFGGSEVVVVMSKGIGIENKSDYEYKLVATGKTSTMQKELQEAGNAGFNFRGQTVFESTFGGKEVVVILERDRDAQPDRHEYKLLATSRTSTMQKELTQAGDSGFVFVGMTVAETAFGGNELVLILRRPITQ